MEYTMQVFDTTKQLFFVMFLLINDKEFLKTPTFFPAIKGDKKMTNFPALVETLRSVKITTRKTLSGMQEKTFILCKGKSLHLSYVFHFPN